MVAAGWTRQTVNDDVGRVRRIFKWSWSTKWYQKASGGPCRPWPQSKRTAQRRRRGLVSARSSRPTWRPSCRSSAGGGRHDPTPEAARHAAQDLCRTGQATLTIGSLVFTGRASIRATGGRVNRPSGSSHSAPKPGDFAAVARSRSAGILFFHRLNRKWPARNGELPERKNTTANIRGHRKSDPSRLAPTTTRPVIGGPSSVAARMRLACPGTRKIPKWQTREQRKRERTSDQSGASRVAETGRSLGRPSLAGTRTNFATMPVRRFARSMASRPRKSCLATPKLT